MSVLKLVKSGGIMGKPISASTEVNMTENALYDALMEIEKERNPLARDAFSFTAYIGEEDEGVRINPNKAKGKLGQAIKQLLKELKAD